MEEVIMSSPMYSQVLSRYFVNTYDKFSVNGAIMFGREHNQAGILIEPSPSNAIDVGNLEQVINLRNKLWCVGYT